jgi:hypothetical protein
LLAFYLLSSIIGQQILGLVRCLKVPFGYFHSNATFSANGFQVFQNL